MHNMMQMPATTITQTLSSELKGLCEWVVGIDEIGGRHTDLVTASAALIKNSDSTEWKGI